jgi:hypothetical protein
LSEEGNLDGLANLYTLALLHKDLASILASIFSVQGWNTVLFWVMTFLEWLEGGHEVMPTSDTVCDNTLCDTSSDGTLDNSSDGIHGSDDLGLELRWHVELDLLEEVL